MANPFDQFDRPTANSNPFDRFDKPTADAAPKFTRPTSTAGDIARSARGAAEVGAGQTLGGFADIGQKIADKVYDTIGPSPNLPQLPNEVAYAGDNLEAHGKAVQESTSPEFQAATSKGILDEGGFTPTNIASKAVNTVAGMAAPALVGTLNPALGVATFGAQGERASREGETDRIANMTDEQLAAVPQYQELLQKGMRPDAARAALTQEAADRSALVGGAFGAGLGVLGKIPGVEQAGQVLGNAAAKFVRPAVARVAGKAAAEGAGFGAINAAGQVAENTSNVLPTDTFEGVPEAFASGVLPGAVIGGAHALFERPGAKPSVPHPDAAPGSLSDAVNTLHTTDPDFTVDKAGNAMPTRETMRKVDEAVNAADQGPLTEAASAAQAQETPAATASEEAPSRTPPNVPWIDAATGEIREPTDAEVKGQFHRMFDAAIAAGTPTTTTRASKNLALEWGVPFDRLKRLRMEAAVERKQGVRGEPAPQETSTEAAAASPQTEEQTNAVATGQEQSSVPEQHPDGSEGGQAAEAGGGDRVQREAPDQQQEGAQPQVAAELNPARIAELRDKKTAGTLTPAERDEYYHQLELDNHTADVAGTKVPGLLNSAGRGELERTGKMKPFQLRSDVDDFKRVNDAGGHGFGDQVLALKARAYREAFGPGNSWRDGGDEFGGHADTQEQLDRAREHIANVMANAELSFTDKNGNTITRKGFGVSFGSAHDADPLKAREAADHALDTDKAARKAAGKRIGVRERQGDIAEPAAERGEPAKPAEPTAAADNQPVDGSAAGDGTRPVAGDVQADTAAAADAGAGANAAGDVSGEQSVKPEQPEAAVGKSGEAGTDVAGADGAAGAAAANGNEGVQPKAVGRKARQRSGRQSKREEGAVGEPATESHAEPPAGVADRDAGAGSGRHDQSGNGEAGPNGDRGTALPDGGADGARQSRRERVRAARKAKREAVAAARAPNNADGEPPKKQGKAYRAEVERATEVAQRNAKEAPRETVTPSEDSHLGNSVDGHPLYERKDGSRYILRNGRPDFGGLLLTDAEARADREAGKDTSSNVEAAARDSAAHPESEQQPTPAQHEANNFAQGHVNLHGLDVTIQVPKGGMRRGIDKEGKPWEREASDHYGHIRRTEGADGEQVDVYLGPHAEDPNAKVFVINQNKAGSRRFDEHKAMIGYPNGRAARKSYDANFPKGLKVFGGIREMSMPEFKEWVKNGDTTKPAARGEASNGTRSAPQADRAVRDDAAQLDHGNGEGGKDAGAEGSAVPAKAEAEQPAAIEKNKTPDERISEAEAAGVTLSEKDKSEIRSALARAEDARKKANRAFGRSSDPMNKGNAFPLGVGFTKMTKRKSQAIDRSVDRAGEGVKFHKQAEASRAYAEALLAGKGTEAQKAGAEARRATGNDKFIAGLVSGQTKKFGKFEIVRVTKDADGYPSSITIAGDGIVKGVDDKINIAKMLFGGNRAELRASVDRARAAAQPEPGAAQPHAAATAEAVAPHAEAPKVATETKTGESIVKAQQDLMQRLRDGKASVEEYKAGWKQLQDNRAAVMEHLASLSKEQLLREFGTVSMRRSDPKDSLVKSAFHSLEGDFQLHRGLSYMMGEGNGRTAREEQVVGTDQAALDEYAKKAAEYKQHREERQAGIENPKTLEDYQRAAAAAGGESKLSPEQHDEFDRLRVKADEQYRAKQAERETVVKRVDTGNTDMKLVETKHTQKGHDLFVVQLGDRVERDVYTQLNAAAKKLGGYYSSFRGKGAVPGFQFRDRAAAEQFMALRSGDQSAADRQAERAGAKAEHRAETLAEKAASVRARAEEDLNRDRKANTARRAAMAASAEANAREAIATATTMENIAKAQQEGTAGLLSKVAHRSQVDLLEKLARRQHWNELRDKGVNWEKAKETPISKDMFTNATLPQFYLSRGDAIRLARRLMAATGGKEIGRALAKMVDYGDEYAKAVKENPYKFALSRSDGGLAFFERKRDADAALARSKDKVRGTVVKLSDGRYAAALAPDLAIEEKRWAPDYDKKVNLSADAAEKMIDLMGAARGDGNIPYWWQEHLNERNALKALGITKNFAFREAMRQYLTMREGAKGEDRVRKLERALVGRKDVGNDFFPTPPDVVSRLVEQADIGKDMRVLEPSAGKGDIAEAVRDAAEGVKVDTIEPSGALHELLNAKGFDNKQADFLAEKPEPVYDRIVMNPPFGNDSGAAHVQHAYEFLKPGGRLVAVMGNGARGREAFEKWLDDHGGVSEELPEGSFKSSFRPTGVSTRVVVLDKPEGKGQFRMTSTVHEPTEAQRAESVRDDVSDITKGWGENAPRVRVVDTPEQLPAAAKRDPGYQRARAYYDGKGTAYVVASAHADRASIERSLAHEAVGHHGIEAIMNDHVPGGWDRLVKDIAALRESGNGSEAMRSVLADVDRRYAGADDATKAKETLAVMAERGVRNGLLSRAVAAIKAFLRKIMPNLKFGERDFARLLAKSEEYIRAGETNAQRQAAVGAMAFDNASPVDSAAFKRWFGKSAVKDERGAPLVMFHGTGEDFNVFGKDKAGIATGHATAPLGHFFTPDRKMADRYAENASEGVPANKRIVDAYLRIEKPYEMSLKEAQGIETPAEAQALRARLEKEGYDGIHIAGADSWVPFESEQIKSASENRGTYDPENPNILFDKAADDEERKAPDPSGRFQAATASMETLGDVLSKPDAGAYERAKAWLAGKAEDFRPAFLGALQRRHLTELMDHHRALRGYGKDYDERVQKLEADRQQLLAGAPDAKEDPTNMLKKGGATIAEETRKFAFEKGVAGWLGRRNPEMKALADVMHVATLHGIDPAEPYTHLMMEDSQGKFMPWTPQAVKERINAIRGQMRGRAGDDKRAMMDEVKALRALKYREAARTRAYPELVAAYQKLSDKAKDLYRQHRDWYTQMRDETEKGLIARVEAIGRDMAGRTGDDLQKQYLLKTVERIRAQFEMQRMEGVYFPLSRDGDFWISFSDKDGAQGFKMFETAREAEAAERKLKDGGFRVEATGRRDGNYRAKDAPSGTFVADVIGILKKSGAPESVQDEIYQQFLRSLPEMSMRKHSIHRKKVPGFSEDVLRTFSKNAFHGAHQLARLRHAHELTGILDAAKMSMDNFRRAEEGAGAGLKEVARGDALLGELRRRHDYIMSPKDSQLANVANSIGFLYHLGASPASALTNLTQNAQVTFPVLGAHHGFAKAGRVLGAAVRDALRTGGNIDRTLTDPLERQAYNTLRARGDIDKTQTHSLAALAEGNQLQSNPLWARPMAALGYLFHKAEVVNREAAGIAAFRLARSRGDDFNAAVQYASDIINGTHFDYSSSNRARYMQGNVPRIVTQFKNYALGMSWMLYRNLYQAMKGETPQVRAVARKTLTGILGTTAVMAGTMGLPMINAMRFAGNAAHTLFGDDEPFDFDTEYRNWLAENLGETAAKYVADGAVNQLTGANLASRVSLSNLWFQDADRELEGKDAYYAMLESIVGPIGGIAKNVFVGSKMISDGHTERGWETILPKFVKDAMKATRFHAEGANTLRGDPIIPDVTGPEQFAQLLGFGPTRLAEQQKKNNAIENFQKQIQDQRVRLLNAYAMAIKAGADTDTAMEKIHAFNAQYPEIAIKSESIRQSLRARARYSAEQMGGIVPNRKLAARLRGMVGEENANGP